MLLRDLASQNGTVLLRQGREFRLGEETIFPTDTLRFGEVTLLAREIFEALSKPVEPPTPVPVAAPKAPLRKPAGAGGALIRCGCGAIKTRGQLCPVCGE